MKTISIIFFLLLSHHNLFAEEPSFFNNSFGDYSENLIEAKDAEKEGIFIFFHLNDCPFCDKMRKTVLNKKNVITYFKKHFLNFAEEIESDVEIIDFQGKEMKTKIFAQKYNRIRATPVLAFFNLQGDKVFTRIGFANEKEFLLLAKYVVEKAYLQEKFIRYKRRHKKILFFRDL